MNVYVSVTVMCRFDEFDSIRLDRIRAMVGHFSPVLRAMNVGHFFVRRELWKIDSV